jgi:hypothetical protein
MNPFNIATVKLRKYTVQIALQIHHEYPSLYFDAKTCTPIQLKKEVLDKISNIVSKLNEN